MNNIPKEIISTLSELKNEFDIFSIKAEFEAEGATYSEVNTLKELLDEFNINLTLKIGGCGAINDMYFAKEKGARIVVAPMIETPYAAEKFINSINKVYSVDEIQKTIFLINIETIEGFNNFDKIQPLLISSCIQGVVFGRSDFAYSLGLNKDNIDSNQIFGYVNDISNKVCKPDKIFTLGGGISFDTIDFVSNLKYLNFVETRKVVFNSSIFADKKRVKSAITLAHKFEALWMQNKNLFGGIAYKGDVERIKSLELTCI